VRIPALSAGVGATPVLAMLHASAAGPRRGRSDGFTGPVTTASIRSPQRRARSSRLCPAATAISATALHVQETGWLSISTLQDARICKRSRNLGSRAMPISISEARPPS
jgi:hypothetical protein